MTKRSWLSEFRAVGARLAGVWACLGLVACFETTAPDGGPGTGDEGAAARSGGATAPVAPIDTFPAGTAAAPQPAAPLPGAATPTLPPAPASPPEPAPPPPEPVVEPDPDLDGGVDPFRVPGDGDLGAPCNVDADCRYGICYVPGPGPEANPICTKACGLDADCGEGAACVDSVDCGFPGCTYEGRCFVTCGADTECRQLNARHTDCESSFDQPCNPIACVDWGPELSICIQGSEP